jgi:hypothetical protein
VFFDLALEKKRCLPPNHPGHKVMVSDLWDKFTVHRVPAHQMENFIDEELSRSIL